MWDDYTRDKKREILHQVSHFLNFPGFLTYQEVICLTLSYNPYLSSTTGYIKKTEKIKF